MLIFVVCVLLGFFFLLLVDEDLGSAIFGAILGGVVGFILALMIGGIIHTDSKTEKIEIPLVTLQDGKETQGSFVLGTGTIEGIPVYSWYEQTGPNDYELRDADASASVIHYLTDDRTPYLVKRWDTCDGGPWIRTWGWDFDDCYKHNYRYDFYVPKGSISNDYTLDAK